MCIFFKFHTCLVYMSPCTLWTLCPLCCRWINFKAWTNYLVLEYLANLIKRVLFQFFFSKSNIKEHNFFVYTAPCYYCARYVLWKKKKEKKCIMEKLDCSCFVETIVDAKIFLCSETFLNKHMACGISVNNTINYNPQIFSVIFSFISI